MVGDHVGVSIRARHRWRAIPPPLLISDYRSTCFNPRPPSMAGDPAGTCSRSLPSTKFQSAPAIDGGRSASKARQRLVTLKFQSAPAIDGGRSGGGSRRAWRAARFNPRPPSMAGDPHLNDRAQHQRLVSIRARHRWRAIHCSTSSRRAVRCFNPRPPSMAGDPLHLAHDVSGAAVSIRARHRWRAIRFARNSLLSNHIFDVQREHDDQAHLVARRRHKSTDQFQQTQ